MAKEQQVHLSMRVSTELAEALARVATYNDRTVSAELRRLIRQHVGESRPLGEERRAA